MKRNILVCVIVLVLGSALVACGGTKDTGGNVDSSHSGTSSVQESKNLDYFKSAFEDAGYVLEAKDKPMYSLIQAADGITFNIGNDVFKIYEYKDEAAYTKATEDAPMVKDMTRNGLFVAESSSKDLLEFFSKIK